MINPPKKLLYCKYLREWENTKLGILAKQAFVYKTQPISKNIDNFSKVYKILRMLNK